jgi:hypothetical protein
VTETETETEAAIDVVETATLIANVAVRATAIKTELPSETEIDQGSVIVTVTVIASVLAAIDPHLPPAATIPKPVV